MPLERIPRATVEFLRNALGTGGMEAARAALRDAAALRPPRPLEEHLEHTLGWIYRAHDACNQGGVARSYTLRRHRRYGVAGWLPAYPETTGYIIPTLYDAAAVLSRPEAAERAGKMARWEAAIQMPDGAVRGGTVADEPSPAVFNTGQVIFGWVRAAEETGDPAFEEAAARAARFLVEAQDRDGSWRRGASLFASSGGHVYNARAAWGLALYGKRFGDEAAVTTARRSAEFAVAQQNERGWYAENCLTDHEHPLVHTIAYAAQGVLEIGLLLEDDTLIGAARRTALALAAVQRDDGSLAGRYDASWRPAAAWSCLTGNAQMALVWQRLAQLEGRADLREAAGKAIRHVCATQDLDTEDGGVRGGVAGSFPIWGEYGRYEYLNWAAKFLLDALLCERSGVPCGTSG